MTLSHLTRVLVLSMPLALGMACNKGSEPASQAPAASTPASDEPAAAGDTKQGETGQGETGASAAANAPANAAGDESAPPAPTAGRADVAQFQALFTPVWNAQPEAARAGRACEAAGALKASAEAIDKRTPPTGADAEAWLSTVERLQDYISEIGVYCEDGEDADTDAILDLVANAHKWLQTASEMLKQ